jgi:hypothetical protein
MKKILLIVGLLISSYTKAEYNEWNFKITIKTVEGKEVIGYGRTIKDAINTDSLENTNYLIKNLTEERDNIYIYLNRIVYTNTSDMAPMQSAEYVLLNRVAIASEFIQSLKISEWKMGSTLSNIDNNITLSDTSWIYHKPVTVVHINANSCEYDIFIHKKSKKLDSVIQEFKAVAKKHETDDDPVNVEEMREHQQLIREMQGLKVVVISFCTC